jgi:hypothetical protein
MGEGKLFIHQSTGPFYYSAHPLYLSFRGAAGDEESPYLA